MAAVGFFSDRFHSDAQPAGFASDLPGLPMIADSSDMDSSVGSPRRAAWADTWHLWKVMFPRRSITGRLVWGTVWRRRSDERRWIYKKFVEYQDDETQLERFRQKPVSD